MKKDLTIEILREQNVLDVLRNGPGLRTNRSTWIVARAPGRVKIGGLGALGVGEMWFPEEPNDRQRPGYADAPTLPSVPD